MAIGMLIYQFEFVMPFEAHIGIGMEHSGIGPFRCLAMNMAAK